MNVLERLQMEADDLAFRQATFDSEELPETPLLRGLILEAREIRRKKLEVLETAIAKAQS